MRLRLLISFALIAILSLPCAATQPLAVKDYLAARKKQPLLKIEQAQADPGGSIGKVVEIRGRLNGFSGDVMIVRAAETSFLVEFDSVAPDNPGVDLACLVKVGEGSIHGLSDLKLICCAYDAEIRRIEEADQHAREARAAAAAKPKPAPAANTATKTTAPAAASWNEVILAYKKAVKGFNKKLSDKQADTIARSIIAFSLKYKIDARLVCAVILAESNFRIEATSHCGAMGLGQLMPTTAAGLGVNNAYDPVENIYGSARYIKSMLERTAKGKQWNDLTFGDLALALAAYNAGPGAVKKYGGIPPYRETQNYVKRVTSIYKKLCGIGG